MSTPNWWGNDSYNMRAVNVPQQNSWQWRQPNPYSWYESEATNIPSSKANWWKGTGKPGKEKFDKKGYLGMLDKWAGLATGFAAQSPTRYTPQAEEGLMNTTMGTMAEQNADAANKLDSQFAQRGMYGQGANQAADREAAQSSAAKASNLATNLENQMNNVRYDDYINWWNRGMGARNKEWQKKEAEQQLALQQTIAARGMPSTGGGGFDWMSLIKPVFGSMFGGGS